MVVPYTNKPFDNDEAYMHKLDISMSEILKKKGLSQEEKLKLYNQLLNRYLLKKENTKIDIINHPAEQVDGTPSSIIKPAKRYFKKGEIKKELFTKNVENTQSTKLIKKKKSAKQPKLDQDLATETQDDDIVNVQKTVLKKKNTRSHVKVNNIPLEKDPNWQMASGLEKKWLSAKFF